MHTNRPKLAFKDKNDLLPAIVQDIDTRMVLMLGYVNEEAIDKTLESGMVTFFSRSKQRLWTKGETSGNFLEFISWDSDCDQDALLVYARPKGPTCHTGTDTCWGQVNTGDFLSQLEQTIQQRRDATDPGNSYTRKLMDRGINKVAQKVGEEAVELVIEAKDDNKELFLGEAADLMYHYLVLLAAKGYDLDDVKSVLKARHS
ncbi:MAG: bifunctional phosphoribosyl-AMP cyclohydrolase/phosphoribosyl-ATP diphosphatase HisIE [Bacteroidota bacterium]